MDATDDAGETRPRPPTDRPDEAVPEWPPTRESRAAEGNHNSGAPPEADDTSDRDDSARSAAEDSPPASEVTASRDDAADEQPTAAEEPPNAGRHHAAAVHSGPDGASVEADDADLAAATGPVGASADSVGTDGSRPAAASTAASSVGPEGHDGPAETTTVLPATADAATVASAEATTVLPAASTGHAAVPGPADPTSGFLVAQDLSATGTEGAVFTSVSVTAQRGEVVAIVGPAGTGRTALLLALSGRFGLQSGSLSVAGQSRGARIRDAIAVAWAPPAVTFDDNHTVAAVLWESATVGGVTEAEVRRRGDDLGLALDTGAAFGSLSRVDQTLLALAAAWATDVPAIAVDDLDSGVDDEGRAALWQAVRSIADDHRLVLATAVRAGGAADRVVRPRPLARHRHPH